jgi:phospholipid transport system substrate-binding protein
MRRETESRTKRDGTTTSARTRREAGGGGRRTGIGKGRALLVVAGALLLLGQALPLRAQDSPVEVIRARNQKVRTILEAEGDSVSDETREELKDVINGLMDFRELSRRALGRYWDDRTEEEKDDFVNVFRQLVRNSSVRKLGVHRADSVVYREPEISDGQATVTTIGHKDRRTVEIVYHMHRTDDEWLAFDVIIDGSSTVRTYRDSFYQEIQATSYEAMFERLREKLAEEEGQASSA